jgi:hypothetical protein
VGLKVCGGYVGWVYIEEFSYSLLLDYILAQQEVNIYSLCFYVLDFFFLLLLFNILRLFLFHCMRNYVYDYFLDFFFFFERGFP